MYSAEDLFIWNIEKLREISANPTPENLFESSGNLRRLLLDKNPLVHQVNRKLGLKIYFLKYPGGPWEGPPEGLNLKKFLNMEVMFYEGTWVTVRDTIDYVRNYAGLEHKNEPNTDETRALHASGTSVQIGGIPSVLYSLRPIISMTLHGCAPIFQRLREQESKPG